MVSPDKCCAKCGFLCGLAIDPGNIETAIFDPDLIRAEDYPPTFDKWPGIITSKPFIIQEYFIKSTPDLKIVNERGIPKIKFLTWGNTRAIGCYLNIFPYIMAQRINTSNMTDNQADEALALSITNSWETIALQIRSDKSDCKDFFPYQYAHSSKQHIDLRMEEKRIQREEEHERKLAEWSNEQEKRLTEWSNSQESRWQRFQAEREKVRFSIEENWNRMEIRLVMIFGVLGLLFTAIQILASMLIAK